MARMLFSRRRRVGAATDPPPDDQSLARELRASCRAMTRHLVAIGAHVPPWIAELVDSASEEVSDLTKAHDALARSVHPALPGTLVLLERERHAGRLFASLGPVKLVRQLMVASGFFLATFLLTSLSPDVNVGSGDIFQSSGWELLVNETFLLSAAGIGASFAALFQVNRYVAKGTYDPRYDTSYWTRFILGLIAGIVLAELLPVEGSFTRPLLSLVGGFSASVVYRILTRIVETLESFVSGELPEGVRAEHSAPADPAFLGEDRAKLVNDLIALRREATDGPAVEKKLDEIVMALVGGDAGLTASPDGDAAPGA